ncbi:TapB family protein [Carboxylicivirga taeanensis]|uniref:TapB family protein n=1 Tax=Carboxylicivirga taeanensis TaxID=1416875 RepID=UPI003F6E3693
MKNFFTLFFFLGGLTLLSTSCQKDTITDHAKALLPLHENNSWTYQQTWENYATEYIDTIINEIGKKTIISGFEGYAYNIGERPHNATFLINKDIDGNLILVGGISDVDTLLVSSTYYKYDAKKGESWAVDNVQLNENGSFLSRTLLVTCLNSDTLITTPSGTFNCIAFEQSPNAGENVFRYYFAKNIGIVKSEHFELKSLLSSQELISYELIK